jgi:hypothetical protein
MRPISNLLTTSLASNIVDSTVYCPHPQWPRCRTDRATLAAKMLDASVPFAPRRETNMFKLPNPDD